MTVTIDGTTGVSLVQDGVVTAADLAGDVSLGKVLQVVSTTKTDTTSDSSNAWLDFGLTVNITPSSTSSKILLLANVTTGGSGNISTVLRFTKDGSALGVGDIVGNRGSATTTSSTPGTAHAQGTPLQYLDSPSSTSQVTYKVQYHSQNANTSSINRNTEFGNDSNTYNYVFTSTLTAMEIAG